MFFDVLKKSIWKSWFWGWWPLRCSYWWWWWAKCYQSARPWWLPIYWTMVHFL